MIKVAICQMGASKTAPENLATIVRMTEQAVENGGKLDLICFPEYCYFLPSQQSEAQQPEMIPGTYTETMSNLAKSIPSIFWRGAFLSVRQTEGFITPLCSSIAGERSSEITARLT